MSAENRTPTPEVTAPRFIRPLDWEAQTGMSKWSAYRALKAGTLRGVKVGGTWLIERTELENFRSPRPAGGPGRLS